MGTDHFEVHRGPCDCGAGEFIVDCCSPDYGFSHSEWHETSITCRACKAKFSLVSQDDQIILIKNSEIKEREALRNQVAKLSQNLMKHPDVKHLLANLETLLSEQRSVAATYRLLSSANLVYSAIGTFRKEWSDPKSWVQRHVHARNLPRIMKLLNKRSDVVTTKIDEIEQLSRKIDAPFAKVGDPIYSIQH